MNSRITFIVLGLLCALGTAKIDYFWHISDTHVQSDYKAGSDPKSGCWTGTGKAGKFGHYDCRPPYSVELSAMLEMPTRIPEECPNTEPMFVLWTGDSVAKRDGKYSKEAIVYNLQNITEAFGKLRTAFKNKVPIFPIIGNHDAFPQHQLPPHEYWVYDTLSTLWAPFIGKEAAASLKKCGYYTLGIRKGLRLIALNTVLYYSANNMTSATANDPGGQIAWLKKTLEEAKKNDEVVYIAGHIPIRGYGGSFRTHFVEPFLEAMKPYQSIIKGSFWGHCHVDTFQLFGNYTSGDFHVGHLASTMGSANYKNPSFRRYLFDTSKDYDIQDWRTFYMDLEEANKAGKIKWQSLYDAKTAFNIPDATPQSILGLIKNMQNDENLFEAVWSKERGGLIHGECNEACHKRTICTMLHPTESAYNKCYNATYY